MTVSAISLLAGMLANILHEALGQAATALLTGAESGVLSTVAWSSAQDSRLVAAGGTFANLAAALVFWLVLQSAAHISVRWRFLLLLGLAFNVFDGTGYFLFSGVTNFGDWAAVIAGLPAHRLWRSLLIVAGIASYYAAVVVVVGALVRYAGVPRNSAQRLTRLTVIPYFSAVLLSCAAALLNPLGMTLMWVSALPATAGAHSGLLSMRYYIPKAAMPERPSKAIERGHAWVVTAGVLCLPFIFVLGRGITLRR